jgi:hypothetical protein
MRNEGYNQKKDGLLQDKFPGNICQAVKQLTQMVYLNAFLSFRYTAPCTAFSSSASSIAHLNG